METIDKGGTRHIEFNEYVTGVEPLLGYEEVCRGVFEERACVWMWLGRVRRIAVP